MTMQIKKVWPEKLPRKQAEDNDDAYCAWLRTQKSAYSGISYSIQAAHFRQASTCGVAQKPLFHAIPLSKKEHAEQHRIGTFQFAARDWWISQVKKYQERFIQLGGNIPQKYRIKT